MQLWKCGFVMAAIVVDLTSSSSNASFTSFSFSDPCRRLLQANPLILVSGFAIQSIAATTYSSQSFLLSGHAQKRKEHRAAQW